MAASDQTYRSQRALDIAFAVSSLLMLFSLVLMFAQDYYRPWKTEQRAFLKVESVMAEREAMESVFAITERYDEAMYKVVKALDEYKKVREKVKELEAENRAQAPEQEMQG